jgi:hypothetical protein
MRWNLKDTVRAALLVTVIILCILDALNIHYLNEQVALLKEGNGILREEFAKVSNYANAQLQITEQLVGKCLNK